MALSIALSASSAAALISSSGCSASNANDATDGATAIADLQGMASDLLIAPGGLYMTLLSGGKKSVVRVGLDGASEEVLAASSSGWAPVAIAADDAQLYVLQDNTASDAWRFVRIPVPALPASPDVIFETVGHAPASSSWDLNTTHLFWCDDTGLHKLSKNGGAPEDLVPSTYCDLVRADDASVAYLQGGLNLVSTAGGAPMKLVPDISMSQMVLDGSHVYFAPSPGGPSRVARTGGQVETVVEDGGSELAVDDSHLYFTRVKEGDAFYNVEYNVWRVGKSGGTPQEFFVGHRSYSYVLDSSYVYVATSDALFRVAR